MPAVPAPILEASHLIKHYGPRRVLDDVSLALRPGERIALTGPSGSGKSTLLNCLGGVDRIDGGVIRLQGDDLSRMTTDELARVRRSRIGTIFQFFHLLPTLSAAENIELPLQLNGISLPERQRRVQAYLDRVGLQPRAAALPSQLSGGEQQRIAIARALVHQPAVVLADEPTGNLDSANGAKILALLRELTDEAGVALVLVTHDEEAARICHRQLRLLDGRVVAST